MTGIQDINTRKKGMVFTKVKIQKAICISASNIVKNNRQSTSYYISEMVAGVLSEKNISCEILDLRKYRLTACTGCAGCGRDRRCGQDEDFNQIYEKVAGADYLFWISPHCAPIPAKLSILLEKMQKIISLHFRRECTRKTELYGILAGIISYKEEESMTSLNQPGGVLREELLEYKAMVNDVIANALDIVQIRTIPYNSKWDTGIALQVGGGFSTEEEKRGQKMPATEIRKYVELIVQTSKSLYAIC